MFTINQEKLEKITEIINEKTDPEATPSLIESEICADWNEGDKHQEWIDTASTQEIADWIASFYN